MVSNLYFMSQLVYRRYGDYPFVSLIGQWQVFTTFDFFFILKSTPGGQGQSVPVGGLAYYLSPPTSLFAVLSGITSVCVLLPF